MAAERLASYELGNLRMSLKTPPEYEAALRPLERSYELHTAGKGKKDQIEHMKAGNALAKCLRRLRRYEDSARVFTEVAKLHTAEVEEKYEVSRCAMWKEHRPATAVSDARVWSGASFYEMAHAQHELNLRGKNPAKPLGAAELFQTLRSETPEMFKFSTWGDAADPRPATAEADRTRAMKRYEDDEARERTQRVATRREAGLPPLEL